MQIESKTDSADVEQSLAHLAQRHGFSEDAVRVMWEALVRSSGTMAQFSHAEFGGRGQWMGKGMVMVGDMFNRPLAARVDALCSDLAQHLLEHPDALRTADPHRLDSWWPAELSRPAATGAQNEMRYAWFPAERRLAVEREGQVELYDTAHHVIGGVAQQQGSQSAIRFTSQDGIVDLNSLERLSPQTAPARKHEQPASPARGIARTLTPIATDDAAPQHPAPAATAETPPQTQGAAPFDEKPEPSATDPAMQAERRTIGFAAVTHDQVLETLTRLGDLHKAGVLTAAEFQQKKTELLERL